MILGKKFGGQFFQMFGFKSSGTLLDDFGWRWDAIESNEKGLFWLNKLDVLF